MKTLSIGRDVSNDIVVNDPMVSRRHAQLTIYDNGQVQLKDLGSSNGTYVNGNKISNCNLKTGDVVKIATMFLNWLQYTGTESSNDISNAAPSGNNSNHLKLPNHKNITSITLILIGNIFILYSTVYSKGSPSDIFSFLSGTGLISLVIMALIAIFGYIIYFIGLSNFKTYLDNKGRSGVNKLIWSAILLLIGTCFGFIPLIGFIIAGLLSLIAFILQIVGLANIRATKMISLTGKSGVTYLLISVILGFLGGVINIVPFIGTMISSIIYLLAAFLVPFGWLNIQIGIIENNSENPNL